MRYSTQLLVLTGILSGLLWADASHGGDLQVGNVAPEFQCLDDQGQIWKSRDHVGKQLVVVYFYPSAFSFCCTRQAVRYRDRLRDICNEGAEVVGVSGDAVEAHRLFQATHKLNFSLLSDEDGNIARQFGVPLRIGGKAIIENAQGTSIKVLRQVTAARCTFVIDKDGRVIYRETEVSPVKDSQEVLEFLRKLNAE